MANGDQQLDATFLRSLDPRLSGASVMDSLNQLTVNGFNSESTGSTSYVTLR